MGSSRNSYFTTAPDTAFMRMKEDPMRNGQLKPGYHSKSQLTASILPTWMDGFWHADSVHETKCPHGDVLPYVGPSISKALNEAGKHAAENASFKNLRRLSF